MKASLNLNDANVLKVTPFNKMGTPMQLIKAFGNGDAFIKAAHDLQSALYEESA